jgi:hypothetical protein
MLGVLSGMVQAKLAGRNPRLDRSRHRVAAHHLLPPQMRQTMLLWTEQIKSRTQDARRHYNPVQRPWAADPELDQPAKQRKRGTQ